MVFNLPSTGERLLKPLDFYDGTNILTVYSQVPAKGSNAFDASIGKLRNRFGG